MRAFAGFAFGGTEQILRLARRREMKPAAERAAGAEGFRLAGEQDEGELRGLGRQRIIATRPFRSHMDECGVAGDQRVECGLAAMSQPVGEQFNIGGHGGFHGLTVSVRMVEKTDKNFRDFSARRAARTRNPHHGWVDSALPQVRGAVCR